MQDIINDGAGLERFKILVYLFPDHLTLRVWNKGKIYALTALIHREKRHFPRLAKMPNSVTFANPFKKSPNIGGMIPPANIKNHIPKE